MKHIHEFVQIPLLYFGNLPETPFQWRQLNAKSLFVDVKDDATDNLALLHLVVDT